MTTLEIEPSIIEAARVAQDRKAYQHVRSLLNEHSASYMCSASIAMTVNSKQTTSLMECSKHIINDVNLVSILTTTLY